MITRQDELFHRAHLGFLNEQSLGVHYNLDFAQNEHFFWRALTQHSLLLIEPLFAFIYPLLLLLELEIIVDFFPLFVHI